MLEVESGEEMDEDEWATWDGWVVGIKLVTGQERTGSTMEVERKMSRRKTHQRRQIPYCRPLC